MCNRVLALKTLRLGIHKPSIGLLPKRLEVIVSELAEIVISVSVSVIAAITLLQAIR